MANEENLKNGEPFQYRSGEEAARNGREGGKKSGEARRHKRDMKNAARMLLNMQISPLQSNMKAVLQSLGIPEDEMNYQMAVLAAQLLKAGNGDTQAATFLRDTVGENPNVQIREKELAQRREEMRMAQKKEQGESTLADAIERAYEGRMNQESGGSDE